MIAELLQAAGSLIDATMARAAEAAILVVVLTAAVLLVCALRGPVRRASGARVAYLLWAAVPVALLASMLPTARLPAPVLQALAPLRHLAADVPASPADITQWPQWLATAWLAGCALRLAALWRAHADHRRSLGALRLQDGIFHAASAATGPAVIGCWRPIIVVPADFATRYTPREQQLILAHEATHVRRHDPLANLLCALLQCAFWFHPLIHLAAHRFRLDQELACDAAVMQRHPGQKRSYAEAMLKTQMSTQTTLIHCHWQSHHPLKERIMQLQQTPPRKSRKLLGSITVAAIIGACGYGAMAASATPEASAGQYLVAITLTADGASSSPTVLASEGAPFAVASQGWRSELVLKKSGVDSVFVKALIKHDDRVVGNPGLLVKLDQQAAVAVDGGYKLRLTISKPRG